VRLSQSILSFVAYLNRGSLRHTFATSPEPNICRVLVTTESHCLRDLLHLKELDELHNFLLLQHLAK
jgi:formyltetrahydrofolate hydrolase